MADLPPEVLSEATEAYRCAVTSGISKHVDLVRIVLEAAARFEDPSGEPYTVSPASKLPEAAVRAAAEAMQEEEDTRTWPTILTLARIALEAAEPLRVAHARAQAVQGLDISRGSDLVADAVDAWHDAPVNEHGGIPLDEHMAFILAVVVPTVAAQERADERRKVAEEIREIVEDDGPIPLENWRAFKARHERLVTGDSVVAVLLAVADEIEALPERTETDA
jgi:hypothetical protein